jgi:hypothetical protein
MFLGLGDQWRVRLLQKGQSLRKALHMACAVCQLSGHAPSAIAALPSA